MTNLEYLQKKFNEDERSSLHEIELDMSYRKVIALEIIAEELCKFNAREDNKYSGEEEKLYVEGTPKKQIIKDIEKCLNL